MLTDYSTPKKLKTTHRQSTYSNEKLVVLQSENDEAIANFALSFHNGTLNRLEYFPSSPGCTVVKVNVPAKSQDYFIKCFSYKSFYDSLKQLIFGSHARRGARGAALLAKEGFFAPQAAAIIEIRSKLLVNSSLLVTPGYLTATTLVDVIRKNELSASEKRKLLETLANVVAEMHKKNIKHGELNPGNILVYNSDNAFEFIFLDNEKTKKGLSTEGQIKNIQQLNKIKDGVSKSNRLRFWKKYSRHFSFSKADEKAFINQVLERTKLEWDKGWDM